MANRIAAKPKLSNNGNATLATRVPPPLRESLIAIAERRNLPLNKVVVIALTQYVKADERKQR